jgi:hemoglobin
MEQPETPYEKLGGENVVRELVARFYELMDTLPEAYDIRKIHQKDLSSAGDKLFMFLSGWLGGPSLYIEKYGHPRLRQRHFPFAIGEKESQQWMLCMTQAINEKITDEKLGELLITQLSKTANHMINQ